jgi:hypothetical protein
MVKLTKLRQAAEHTVMSLIIQTACFIPRDLRTNNSTFSSSAAAQPAFLQPSEPEN